MRTVTQETAPQIALRNCSKEVRGKVSIYAILVKGECMQSNTYFFFCRRFLLVLRSSCHHEKFGAFLDMRKYKD